MRRICNAIVAVMLSLLVIYLAVGATYVQCRCTGKTHFMNPLDKKNYADNRMMMQSECAKMTEAMISSPDCMKVSMEKLSASLQATSFHHDFAIDQPLLFTILPAEFVSTLYNNIITGELYIPDKVPIPPRRYLALKRSLLI